MRVIPYTIGSALFLSFSFSSQLMAGVSCPAKSYATKVCGTLTVTDFMGVPETTPKFWIESDGERIRLGSYSNWGSLALASYMHENVCLFSDQEILEDTIDIAEICKN